jgi:hypothetical protein
MKRKTVLILNGYFYLLLDQKSNTSERSSAANKIKTVRFVGLAEISSFLISTLANPFIIF